MKKRNIIHARILTVLIAAAMMITSIPFAVFAENVPVADAPGVISQENGSVSFDNFDSDELLMQYIDQKVAEGTGPDSGNRLSVEAVHKRRAVLDVVAGNMYDALAPSVRAVAAGDQADTAFAVPAPAIFNSAKYDAEDLGVATILDKDGKITREAFDAFVKKLYSDLTTPLSDMFDAMIADMPYELYWLDNEAGINFVFNNEWFENNMILYNDGCIGIETNDSLVMTFTFYVSQDYSLGGSPSQYGPKKTTKVDTSFTKAAANTAKNITGIIEKAKGKPDDERLYQYKDDICDLASYHPTAMKDPNFPYGDPWQLIYVFDGDPNTKVVCEGYSKAFQYLCDKTTFNDSNVESRLVSGNMIGKTKGQVVSGAHMWNIVHMDDGKNYIADITNCDDESYAGDPQGYPDEVFLSGAMSGSVRNGYTFRYDDGILRYQYEAKILKIYSEEELTLSFDAYPYGRGAGDDLDPADDVTSVTSLKGNPLSIEGKTATLKYSKLRKKAQALSVAKLIDFKAAGRGEMRYSLASAKKGKKSFRKYFSINRKTGKVTVNKKLRKGIYKVKIKVSASGDAEHMPSGTKTVTCRIRVK